MPNSFGIPEKEESKIRSRDSRCVYCHKEMIYPYVKSKHNDSATIEHLNFDGPFFWNKGMKIGDVVICCGECNSSRGGKKLPEWFRSDYCKKRNIDANSVAFPVKLYLTKSSKEWLSPCQL